MVTVNTNGKNIAIDVFLNTKLETDFELNEIEITALKNAVSFSTIISNFKVEYIAERKFFIIKNYKELKRIKNFCYNEVVEIYGKLIKDNYNNKNKDFNNFDNFKRFLAVARKNSHTIII